MKNLLVGLAALPFLAGVAMADQPTVPSDAQMDAVTAGLVEALTTVLGNGINLTVSFPCLDGALNGPAGVV
jgi:hypothetical protein